MRCRSWRPLQGLFLSLTTALLDDALPVINIEALLADPSSPLGRGVGDAVFEAARDRGFFLVIYPGFFYLEKFIALLP